MKNIKIKKYPRSVNNKQCLGPCYEKDVSLLHPLFLHNFENEKFRGKPFCPTDRYEYIDEITNVKEQLVYDTCENPTHGKDVSTQESLLFFQSGFTKDLFLHFYYNINSFSSTLEWIDENKFTPVQTRTRIINAALNLYGDRLEYLDDIFIFFYIEYIKDKFINKIYDNTNEYIGIQNEEILIVNPTKNNLKKNDLKIERTNYIAEKFLNTIEIKKFLFKYIKNKTILFENYNDSLYLIYQDHLIYIKNIIKNILSK